MKYARAISPAIILAACLLSPLLAFLYRAPVVVVSDAAFESLYGEGRAAAARAFLSSAVCRRVVLVLVSEQAAPESAADAAAAASAGRGAAAVVFPSRYESGAAVFASRNPLIPLAIVGDPRRSISGAGAVVPDRAADLRLAGRIAAIAAGREGSVLPVEETGVPAAPNGRYIAFTWLDPALLPKGAAAVFDDSVYASLYAAYRAARARKSVSAESRVFMPFGGKEFLDEYLLIQGALAPRRH